MYTGYCIELLDRLQLDMKFKYTIEVLPVNVYGSKDSFSQKWNGMMEYLVDRVGFFISIFVKRKTLFSPYNKGFALRQSINS